MASPLPVEWPAVPPRHRVGALLALGLLIAYVVACAASFAYGVLRDPPARTNPNMLVVHEPGPVGGPVTLAWREWGDAPAGTPIVLLHGSPGAAADFSRLAPLLTNPGRRIIAPDLPGFGDSDHIVGDMSALAHAHEVLELMDHLRVRRAHLVGWSLGGAVGLHIADLAPDRVASLTLMASVSEQAAEGSGNYWFERAKYAAGWAVAAGLDYGVPHFGRLSFLRDIRASMRNFWDTDMRPLRGIMERLRTPVLILHGRRDFLAPVHDAFRSHELIAPSTLVLFNGTHFIPFIHVQTAASILSPFFQRHDDPGAPALRQSIRLDADPAPILGAASPVLKRIILACPWWLAIAIIALGMARRDRLAASLAIVLVSFVLLDFGVAIAGLLAGQALIAALAYRRGRRLRRDRPDTRIIGTGFFARTPGRWHAIARFRGLSHALTSRLVPGGQEALFHAAAFTRTLNVPLLLGAAAGWVLWAALFAVLTLIAAAAITHPLAAVLGVPGLLAGVILAVYLPRPPVLLLTRSGRTRLRIGLARAIHREYWPASLQYALLAPVIARFMLRHGPATFTCCNPGISGGGGMIGESKKEILDSFNGSPRVLAAVLIGSGPDPAARARAALDAIEARPDLGGFPIILKPDSGQRGFALRLARSPVDVEAYFRAVASPVLVQRFHAGPEECGVLWARRAGPARATCDGRLGSIFSITRKRFPIITGDGRRTLEQLILRHPRYRRQAAVFLERFADQRTRILAEGEALRLAQSGNHCQGTLFADGADLITPELEAVVDDLARSFASPLDMCRFDLRYESDERLRRGEAFAVVELNGTAGESTNVYDPDRSLVWAYRVLAAQCRLLYQLGSERRRAGVRPMSLIKLVRETRRHFRERTGSEVAD